MNTIKTLFLLIFLITILHCSTKGPSSPSGSGKEILVSGTIGPEGGTFGDEDFILTIPPGAFSSDCYLTLYLSDEENPFNESDRRAYGFKGHGLDEVIVVMVLYGLSHEPNTATAVNRMNFA